jgi:thymidine kinase
MLSGKSTELIRYAERALYANKQCVVIRPGIDTRDFVSRSKPLYGSHFPDNYEKCPVLFIHPENMNDMLIEIRGRKPQLVLIDEAQFFPSYLYKYVNELSVVDNIPVVLAALPGDANREPWDSITYLIPYVDDIIKLNAVCQNPECPHHSTDIGTFSFYNGKKTEKVVIDDEKENKYLALCRDCYEQLQKELNLHGIQNQ